MSNETWVPEPNELCGPTGVAEVGEPICIDERFLSIVGCAADDNCDLTSADYDYASIYCPTDTQATKVFEDGSIVCETYVPTQLLPDTAMQGASNGVGEGLFIVLFSLALLGVAAWRNITWRGK